MDFAPFSAIVHSRPSRRSTCTFAPPFRKRRYLWKDKDGRAIETPEQMFHRIAETIMAKDAGYGATESEVNARADELYELISDGIFIPSSPVCVERDLSRLVPHAGLIVVIGPIATTRPPLVLGPTM